METIKNLYNKYFDLIGIKKEGYRRVFVIIFFCFYLYSLYVDGVNKVMKGDSDDFRDIIFYITFIPLYWMIFLGIFTKIFTWVKDGFKKKEDE